MDGLMTCIVTLCFILIANSVVTRGYNGCQDYTWHYHDGSHTCFKLFKRRYTWFTAKSSCQSFWGAPDYSSKGQLAKIDDEETNTFVKGVLGVEQRAWIGLNNQMVRDSFRWQGYPHEEPAFLNFKTAPRTDFIWSAVITPSSWEVAGPNYGRYYICQHKADILRTEITCPPAIEQHQTLRQPFTCKFYFNNWKSVTWFKEKTALASCSRLNSLCHSRKPDFEASLKGQTASLTYNAIISRDLEAGLKCSITTPDSKILDTKTCELQVYDPPRTVDCTHELTRDRLHVLCKTAKIYPQASCHWLYKNYDHTSFQTVSVSEARDEAHEEFYETTDGEKYFKSQCYVNLTRKGTDFKAGFMTVKVIMYPTVKGTDLSTHQDASVEYEERVVIELPRSPVFTINSITFQETINIVEGDDITVMCQVKSGQPAVRTTTLSCGFPFTQSGESQNTWRGISYLIKRTANRDMDGKNCTCWGNHITGSGEKNTLKFKVSYPATVHTFTANERRSQLTIDVGSQVQVRCQSSGNPIPLVDILKTGKLEDIIESGQYGKVLETSFPAKCTDNGRYQCRAQNTVKGKTCEDSWDLDIHVTCLPTACDEKQVNPSFIARIGKGVLVELCAVGYPEPHANSFYLQKENNGRETFYPKQNYAVEHVLLGSQTVSGVKIQFNLIEPSDHGNYTLNYIATGSMPPSKLHFQLSAKGLPGCPKNVTVIAVGHSSVFLSWVPGNNNGYKQTFVLSRHEMSKIIPLEVLQPVDVNEMRYNVTGLSPETDYFIGVEAQNQEGSTSCPRNIVNFTTGIQPKPLAGSDSKGPTIAAVVSTFVIIAIIVVGIAVLLFLRKRKQQAFNYAQASYSTNSAGNQDFVETFGSVSVERKATTVKESPKTEECESEKNLYCKEDHDYIYNNVRENVYNNVGRREETENANASVDYADSSEEASSQSSATPRMVEFESRRNQDGLIYMEAIVDPTHQRPRLVAEHTDHQPKPRAEESVEYSSIDFLATAEVNFQADESKGDC